MSKELVISANRHETKVAILEDDQLVEVYFQRSNEYSLAGSIHKGRVTRVLPGMQSAFVDLGLDRDTFLYVSDFFEENGDDIDRIPLPDERVARAEPPAPPFIETPAPAAIVVSSPPEPTRAQEPAAAAATVSGERTQDPDRRGRRSRRRRNRGRGFPESKYAAAEEEKEESAPEPAAATAEFSEGSRFAVLPGESLAKYRGAPEEDLASDEPEEVADTRAEEALVNWLPDAPAHDPASSSGAIHPAQQETLLPEAGDGVHDDSAEIHQPDAPAIEATTVAVESAEPEPDSEPGLESEPEPEFISESESTSEPEPEPVSGIATRHNDEEEDREIQALILDSDSMEIEEPAQGLSQDPHITANVREQGGRYMHRVSRRMRRRPRGPAGDTPTAPVSSAAPPPPPRHEPRVEPRSDLRGEPRGDQRLGARPDKAAMPSITDLLKEGQEILVQIAKEPLGQKGARITSHIALPGRYVVYMPTLDHMGVSRKIASDEERLRLKKILQKHRSGLTGGFIIRTAGEGKTEDEIAGDMTFLANLWLDIRQKAEKRPAPALLHYDLDIVQRVLRDQVNDAFKSIWVDSEDVYESILRFLQRFQPAAVSRVKLYTRAAPIFDAFNVSSELEKALRPKVWLKSGGYIVINQTEALVAIDVNTGKYVGKSNRLEDTIVKTNTEAVKEIVRQIRLRDLGGIIVIDFIDMDERKNRQKVMQALEEAMHSDRAPFKILQFNDFGLVAITRKRVKQSLERTLCAPCPHCEGAGYVKSVQTIVGEILQEAHKIARAVDGQNVVLRVHPDVAKVLKSSQNKYLEELEEILKRPVLVTGDATLHHEKFDLA